MGARRVLPKSVAACARHGSINAVAATAQKKFLIATRTILVRAACQSIAPMD
jgi:hypothetical protein